MQTQVCVYAGAYSCKCVLVATCMCVHDCEYTRVCFVYMGAHTSVSGSNSPEYLLMASPLALRGRGKRVRVAGWAWASSPTLRPFLLPALEASWLVQLPFVHTGRPRPREWSLATAPSSGKKQSWDSNSGLLSSRDFPGNWVRAAGDGRRHRSDCTARSSCVNSP